MNIIFAYSRAVVMHAVPPPNIDIQLISAYLLYSMKLFFV